MCVRDGRTRLPELDRGEPELAVLGFFADGDGPYGF
jgi:hypothetical protein